MNKIKERLKSPVVWVQIISIIVGVIVYFAPSFSEQIKVVSTAIVSMINIFAGLNNPENKDEF
jgi:hypothetical protein